MSWFNLASDLLSSSYAYAKGHIYIYNYKQLK